MTQIPIELPMKASEAAALADLVFQVTDGKPLSDEIRARVEARAASLGLTTIQPFWGSLAQDPVHAMSYYLAVDVDKGEGGRGYLLRMALASAPSSALFPRAVLIGRMRPGGTREVVVNAIPFGSGDSEAIRKFAAEVDRQFLPRPQGALPAIAVGNRHPEISLPAAFEAFRQILRSTGVNMASTVQLSATREMTTAEAIAARDGETPTAAGHTRVSIPHLYETGLWAAIRAGWREGYNAEADHFIITGETPEAIRRSVEFTKESIRLAAGYTKFTTDTSRLFELRADRRHPQAWTDGEVESRFGGLFTEEEQSWVLDEFGRKFDTPGAEYRFDAPAIRRLAVKFGESLKLNEELYDFIRQEKARSGLGRTFDFEPSIDEAETLTTPEELLFYMQWLKSRGRPAQLVPPNLGFKKRQAYPETAEYLREYVWHKMWPELVPRVEGEFGGRPLDEFGARVRALANVARYFNATLSIHSGSGKQAAALNLIGQACSGRVNYKISGELQLQMFDVLREQDESSPWRRLYERMAERCNEFAGQGAFGDESQLSRKYLDRGLGSYLGDASKGRVDGNLFLVFWVGNLVGSRDWKSPDGDTRFFKEKLDELPRGIVEETRRRNVEYIVWLARELIG